MTRPRASIDIGSHTARLLIASDSGPSAQLRTLVRKRVYIRIAEDFDDSDKRIIQPGAIDRTIRVLHDFLNDIKKFDVESTHAIATGVAREAVNKEEFLGRIREQTGIEVQLVTGEEEGDLTAKGVWHALGVHKSPYLIFDLGGGSTEFIFKDREVQSVKSIPLGAVTLTKKYLKSDPPEKMHLVSISEYIDQFLYRSGLEFTPGNKPFFVVGTGGTVTTLALMVHGRAPEDISAERINGLVLKRQQIETLLDRMKGMRSEERLKLPGLDKGRAGIILAGSLVVLRILDLLRAKYLTVSLSDLLEGILINHFKGEGNA